MKMNRQEALELALDKFDKWPDDGNSDGDRAVDYDGVIVVTHTYDYEDYPEDQVGHVSLGGFGANRDFYHVITKQDWLEAKAAKEKVMDVDFSNAPEGATHIMKRKEQSDVFLKDIDRHNLKCSVWSLNKWEKNVRFFLNDDIIKIEVSSEKYTPKIGEECELSNCGNEFQIATMRYISDRYVIVEHDYGEQHYHKRNVEFRPLRTQEEIEREDLFNECVGALQFIPQCEEVNAHHKDAIEWLIDSGLIVKR